MHLRRNEAIALRKEGKSYKEIEQATGINRSTLSYMLRDVVLTTEQQAVLDERQAENRKSFTDKIKTHTINTLTTEQRRSNTLAWQAQNREKVESSIASAIKVSGLTYRKDELPILENLQRHYAQEFKKEHIGNRFFDFASPSLLIEHTSDGGKGIAKVIDRFSEVRLDSRKKVAFVDTKMLGLKRFKKLDDLGVEVHDYREVYDIAFAAPTRVAVFFPHKAELLHGTTGRYRKGCRCEPCRAAKAEYIKQNKSNNSAVI